MAFIEKGKRFKWVFILMTVVCFSSCGKNEQDQWNTYRSKDKLFKIDYPADWKVALDGHTFNITPPNGTGLVAVTGYVDPGTVFNEKAFQDMVMLDFDACRVEKPFNPVEGGNWVGKDAVYTRRIHRKQFIDLFRIAHRGQVGVFIAVSDLQSHMKPLLPVYQRIMDSLIILNAPTTIENLYFTPTPENKNRPWQETLIDWIRSTEPAADKTKKSYFSE